MEERIKVLVVDDTAFMRKAITRLLSTDKQIHVVGAAENGLKALDMIKKLKPHVVTMDIDMPVMDGLTAIRHIMIKSPVAIVAFSSLFADGAVTFEALRLGVIDFIPKPSGAISVNLEKVRQHIIDRTKMATSMNLSNVRRVRLPRIWSMNRRIDRLYRFYPLEYIVTIGTTLSGPNTVIRIISKLSPTLPAAVVVIQEISPRIISSFVEQFNKYVPWKIQVAKEGSVLEQGVCYISSNELSLEIHTNEDGEAVLISGDRTEYPMNRLFISASRVFRQNTIGLLLTGIGDDGADGFAYIKQNKGVTIVQNTKCCIFPNLTDNAIKNGVADMILDERKLAKAIESLME